ncbi:NAD-dependent epimerase/dehydratase family protein [Kitasatospora sp. McL0602]|uniref:NAD-dependent epimerase/dehydratase family protein n=1 Tax=Kitasatospora sp. McL0602 TaxID=3439530 RepID=UPI003F8AC5BC
MDEARILVTGGTGFIGGEVLRQLVAGQSTRREQQYSLRALVHHRTPVLPGGGSVELVRGDLREAASLRGLCDGVDTLLHLGAQVGGDPELCRQVNVLGTGALLAEAARAGVRRIVQLSTTAIYQDGVHRNVTENQLALEPVSATSRTRLAAEQQVLAAGGTVVRPHLVHGQGDTWVVPAVADLMTRLPHWIDGGRARVSMISVEDLARVLAALAQAPWKPTGPQVYHACHPEPVMVRDLMTAVSERLGLPLPAGDLTLAAAAERLGGGGWERRLSLLGVDHWYESSRLWRRTGLAPGPGFAARFADQVAWYRATLASATASGSSSQ